LTISLDKEVADKLHTAAMKKYGNTRSTSRFIEDLVRSDINEDPH